MLWSTLLLLLAACAKPAPLAPVSAVPQVAIAPIPAQVVVDATPPPPLQPSRPRLCEDFFEGWTTVELLNDRLRIDVPGRQDAPDVHERTATADRMELEIGTGPRPQLVVLAKQPDQSWQGGAWGRLRDQVQHRMVYGRIDSTKLRDGTRAIVGHRSVSDDSASTIFVTVLHPDGSVVEVTLSVRAEDWDVCDSLLQKMVRSLRLGEVR